MRMYNDPAYSVVINVSNFGVFALGKKQKGFA